MKKIDLNKLENIEIDGVDTKDYPDFCDAFIVSASYSDRDLNDAELDELNEDSDFVYDQVIKHLF